MALSDKVTHLDIGFLINPESDKYNAGLVQVYHWNYNYWKKDYKDTTGGGEMTNQAYHWLLPQVTVFLYWL